MDQTTKTGNSTGGTTGGTGTYLAGASKVAAFKILNGDREGSTFRVQKDRIVIGSVISADVRLPEMGVAPIHAVIESMDGVTTIYDLASETGVFVNDQRIVTHRLKSGEKIKIGQIQVQFDLEDNSVAMQGTGGLERIREAADGRRLFLDPKEDIKPLMLETPQGVAEIFDYRPAQKPALEVVMSWHSTILDIEHFVNWREMTVGESRKADFPVPPVLNSPAFPLVVKTGDSVTLSMDMRMKGVVQRNGHVQSLEEIRGASGGQTFSIPFNQGDFAKIVVGEVVFYLSFTAAPPRLKRQKMFESDPLFFKILVASLLFTTAFVAGILQLNPSPKIEAEEIPERVATVLYQPERFSVRPESRIKPDEENVVKPPVEKKPEPPKEAKKKPEPQKTVKVEINPTHKEPKPIPKEMNMSDAKKTAEANPNKGGVSQAGQSEAKEGAGARAKGEEGKRGSKTSKNQGQAQNAAKRPSPQGGTGAGGSNSQIGTEGNVEFLKGAAGKITDLLGGAAARLGKGGEQVKGFGGFTTQGNGGLALSGDGKGGGGTADQLGGLSDHGRGGGRVGTGLGASGTGNGIIGGKARVAIRSGGAEEAVVMGAIDASAIEAAMLAHKDEFRYCYEKEVNSQKLASPNPPKLQGRIGSNFVIGSSGRVTKAAVESSTLGSREVEDCVIRVIKSIEFPIPKGAGVVQVTYPFRFSASGG